MKFFLLLALISLSTQLEAQQAYEKNKFVISGGVGIGNFWKTFLEDAVSYPEGFYKVRSNGTFTVIGEYGISKKISAGVAIGYSKVTGEFNAFNETFTETLTNFSVLARGNYHFGKWKKFDPYVGGGLGYYHFKYYNNTPGIINSKAPGAFAYSAQVGLHYYILEYLGSFIELGYLAGTLVQIGVIYKF